MYTYSVKLLRLDVTHYRSEPTSGFLTLSSMDVLDYITICYGGLSRALQGG